MFVVKDVGRGCAVPLHERVRQNAAIAQCRRQDRQDDGEQTLMRGLVTAFPCVRPGLPRSASGRRRRASATQFIRGFPTEALPPALRNCLCPSHLRFGNEHTVCQTFSAGLSSGHLGGSTMSVTLSGTARRAERTPRRTEFGGGGW